MAVTDAYILQKIRSSDGYKKLALIDRQKVDKALKGLPSVRPRSALGEAAWQLALRIAADKPVPPTADIGVFTKPGAMWVQSDSEDVATARANGVSWALLQLGGDDWTTLASKCNALNLPYGYWFHCHKVSEIDGLLAASVDRPIVGLNVENELQDVLNPVVLRQRIDASGYRGQVVIIAMGWVQNDVRVTDADLGLLPWLLEIFPQDAPALYPPTEKKAQCFQHARELGVRFPLQLMGVYGQAVPSWYSPDNISSIYAANNVEGREGWAAWMNR